VHACVPPLHAIQVISVGAVDWDGQPADFSTFNADVELAGPGVRTLSTIPLALTNESTYHALPYAHGLLAVSPLPPGAAGLGQDFFESPRPARVDGTPSGRVSAPLVDCGLALEPCAGASAGAVCLVQRGNNTFCDKLLNAAAGGCAGVVMFNREDVPSCERLDGVTTSLCPTTPASGWTPAITLSRGQGAELRAALAAEGNGISATLSIADVPLQSEYGLDLLSGTSMATPTVAGVAGLVWSAHTDCTAAEIRAALAATASRPGQLSAAGGGVLTRDEHYGYGIVRAHDAHEYLNAHPCAGRRVELSLSARALGSVRGGGNNGNSNELQGLAVGTTVHVRVSARESVTGAPIAGQRVALSALPPGGDPSSVRPPVMECAMAALTTNAEGIAATTCTMMAPGRVSLNVLALGARNATAEVALSARVRS
jgi:Subtilase family/PA domain